MGTLVVGTDGSDHARAALLEAIDLGRRLDDAIVVVSVSPPPPDYLGRPLWDKWVSEHLGQARAALDAAQAVAQQVGVELTYELLEGDPARELARFAEARDADLLVVGTHGLGVAEVLLGSVAIGLLRRSHRPVVVVREPTERAREEELERALAQPRPAPA
jgi:nucleotide-binding universal stress UspA family protein